MTPYEFERKSREAVRRACDHVWVFGVDIRGPLDFRVTQLDGRRVSYFLHEHDMRDEDGARHSIGPHRHGYIDPQTATLPNDTGPVHCHCPGDPHFPVTR